MGQRSKSKARREYLAELKLFVKDTQPKKLIESDGVAVNAATDINGNSIAIGIKAQKLEGWLEFP